MALMIDGRKYFTTAEACQVAGISKDTFLRWVRTHQCEDVEYRDRHGWRLFTEEEVQKLTLRVNHVERVSKV